MPPGFTLERTRNYRLTGRVRFREADERLGMFSGGKIVALLVEEEFERAIYNAPPRSEADLTFLPNAHWRLAEPLDLSSAALRWMIDGAVAPQRAEG